jgi:hypothetical protein
MLTARFEDYTMRFDCFGKTTWSALLEKCGNIRRDNRKNKSQDAYKK